MTSDPNIVPEEEHPQIESVAPEDPPIAEEELPSDEDIEAADRDE
jgi:hypothetical protein